MAQVVKNLPAMQEMQKMCVQSLSWEDLLDEEIATHSSILAWRIPWTEEPDRLQSMASQGRETQLSMHTSHLLLQGRPILTNYIGTSLFPSRVTLWGTGRWGAGLGLQRVFLRGWNSTHNAEWLQLTWLTSLSLSFLSLRKWCCDPLPTAAVMLW